MDAITAQAQFEAVLALTIHDIKNSLVLLLDKLDTQAEQLSENEKMASVFKYEIRRINNNLVRLLSLYRVGASAYQPQIENHQVSDFIEELALEYQALLTAKGIHVITDVDDLLFAAFDKAMIFSVVENALNNAARYSNGEVKISAQKADGYLKIQVLDDGRGYPESMLEQSREIQSNAPIDNHSGTTGLGIYFSHIMARLHHIGERQGYIEMANGGELGGSRFLLALPV